MLPCLPSVEQFFDEVDELLGIGVIFVDQFLSLIAYQMNPLFMVVDFCFMMRRMFSET
jgi:hypothetical protein